MARTESPWSSETSFTTEKAPDQGTDLDNLTLYENFQDSGIGTAVSDSTELANAAQGVVSSEQAYPGDDRSMKTTVNAGSTGYGDWGFDYSNLPPIRAGGQVWVRVMLYFPSGYNFSSVNKGMGGVSIIRSNADGSGEESTNFTITSDPQWAYDDPTWTDPTYTIPGSNIQTGQWQVWEFALTLDASPANSGGAASATVYKDGYDIITEGTISTLTNNQQVLKRVEVHGDWLGGAPATQSNYIAQVAIALKGSTNAGVVVDDTIYMVNDSIGRKYIGMVTQNEETAPPPPPIDPPDVGDPTRLNEISYYQNFQHVPIGSQAEPHTPEMEAAGRSLCVSNNPYPGDTRCIETYILPGEHGYGNWGCLLWYPDKVRSPGEIWTRIAVKFASNFVNNTSPALKLLRDKKYDNTGGNDGLIDLYLNGRHLRAITESENENQPENRWQDSGVQFEWNRWYMVEQYAYIDGNSAAAGGKGYRKVWVDGQLVIDYPNSVFKGSSHPYVTNEFMLIFTYWNNENPSQKNTAWYGQVAHAVRKDGLRDDTVHLSRDTTGFPFIGMATQANLVERPDPPTNLRVTNNTPTSQTIAWDYGSSPPDNYYVEYFRSGIDSVWQARGTVNGNTRQLTSSGLPSNTSISHRVRAIVGSGTSVWDTVQATTPPPAAPGGGSPDQLPIHFNFEQYSDGQSLADVDAFSANGWMVCTTSQKYSGSRCARTQSPPVGSEGYGNWGFELSGPKLYEGGEVWWRQAVMYPSGFDWNTNTGRLKQMRWRKQQRGTTGTKGYVDLHIGDTGGEWTHSVESADNDEYWYPMGGRLVKGQWAMTEVYLKFDSDTGKTMCKMWIDGVLTGTRTNYQQFRPGTSMQLENMLWCTAWNGGGPTNNTQYHYVDHIAVAYRGATDQGYIDNVADGYLTTDADGFPFIGMKTVDS